MSDQQSDSNEKIFVPERAETWGGTIPVQRQDGGWTTGQDYGSGGVNVDGKTYHE
jgi:hypothetical protein